MNNFDVDITVSIDDGIFIAAECGDELDLFIEEEVVIEVEAFDYPPEVDLLNERILNNTESIEAIAQLSQGASQLATTAAQAASDALGLAQSAIDAIPTKTSDLQNDSTFTAHSQAINFPNPSTLNVGDGFWDEATLTLYRVYDNGGSKIWVQEKDSGVSNKGDKGNPFVYSDFTPEQLLALKGADGDEIELQKTATHIQWRYVGGTWANLVALADLKGADGVTPQKGIDYFDGDDGQEIELQKTATHIQWRYVGGTWANLVLLEDLRGPAGSDASVTKQAVESVLTGEISTHSHGLPAHSHSIGNVNELQNALDGKANNPSRSSCIVIESDFLFNNTTAIAGMLGAAVSSGTVAVVTGSANHPGVVSLRDSTTANGAYQFSTGVTAFLITGGETAIFVFQARSARSTASFRLGFQDSFAIQTQPTDGAWFQSVGDGTKVTLLGRVKNNAGPTDTADPYELTLNTWYTGRIEVNADATLVTFTLYAENGTQLWQKTVNANIPKEAGRECGFGIIAGETSADAAADILWIDYLRMEINRTLTR